MSWYVKKLSEVHSRAPDSEGAPPQLPNSNSNSDDSSAPPVPSSTGYDPDGNPYDRNPYFPEAEYPTMLGRLGLINSHIPAKARAAPLLRGRNISTAACLIIGDEVLGGKVQDSNSAFFAKYCTRNGISLRRVETIPDEEQVIIESARRLSKDFDFVVTSGGIGPTHDDITYSSIAKAFNLPLILEPETYSRLKQFSRKKIADWDADTAEVRAKKKMAILPLDKTRTIRDEQIYFAHDEAMTPLCVVNGNVHILPGVSFLFKSMLEAYEPVLKTKLAKPKQQVYRIVIETPMGESEVAGYLEGLAERVKSRGVKVGSYPTLDHRPNTVDLVGTDREFMEGLVDEVVREVKGTRRETKEAKG